MPDSPWQDRPTRVFVAGFDAYVRDLEQGIHAVCMQIAPQIEAWMKQNAAWTDRTGNARQSLYAEVYDLAMGAGIALDHGVDYGFWLEFANQGEYAIVTPAMDIWGPKLWDAVRRMMS